MTVPKITKHKRVGRYASRKNKGVDYKLYMEEDFHTDLDPSDYDGIVVSLIAFAKEKDLDLEVEMSFSQYEKDFTDEKSDNKEKEKFIWQMANAIDTLLKRKDEEQDGSD